MKSISTVLNRVHVDCIFHDAGGRLVAHLGHLEGVTMQVDGMVVPLLLVMTRRYKFSASVVNNGLVAGQDLPFIVQRL